MGELEELWRLGNVWRSSRGKQRLPWLVEIEKISARTASLSGAFWCRGQQVYRLTVAT